MRRKQNIAAPYSVPAPVGGWNTRDALDAMPATDAVVLDNWFPTTGKVTVRKGYEDHATGVGANNVDTIVEYHAETVQKLLACGDGGIYDATSTGAAVSLGSGFTNDKWQTANFNGRAFFVNGDDAPQDYDGSTLSATSWSGSGLTITDLIDVNVFKNRLFFVEKNSQSFWYGGVNSVSGTLTEFPLNRVGQFGGNLITMGTWTIDGGDGIDDYAVFVMSSGEVIVYQGTDPGSSSAWALSGIYRIGIPLDARGVVKFGGDLLVMTTDDYVSLSEVLRTGQAGELSKLSGAIQEAALNNADSFGWSVTLYRKGNMLIFNVPTVTGDFDQHVINTITGAPCRFKDIPARCWGIFDGDAYFGSTDGTVRKYGLVTDDDGVDISADASTAWTDGGSPLRKRLTAIRPSFQVASGLEYSTGVGFDFNEPLVTSASSISSAASSLWDIALWDVSFWSGELVADSTWRASKGTGYTLSTRIKASTQQELNWLRTDYRIEIGKGL